MPVNKFIFLRLRIRIVFRKLAEVPSFNFSVVIFLYLFLEFKAPEMVCLKRTPLLPSFAISPGQNVLGSINIQFVTAAC